MEALGIVRCSQTFHHGEGELQEICLASISQAVQLGGAQTLPPTCLLP